MQMGSRAPAGFADEADALSVADPLAFFNGEPRQVRIRGGKPTTVIDHGDVPVWPECGGEHSVAGRSGHDRSAVRSAKIEAGMQAPVTQTETAA